jgi:hypothetical protein
MDLEIANKPGSKTYWFNIYKEGGIPVVSKHLHESEEVAIEVSRAVRAGLIKNTTYVKTVQVEIED